MTTTQARMFQRRRTIANWASENPVLAAGEVGIGIANPPVIKVGDGSTAWNDLEDIVGPDLSASNPAKLGLSTTGGVTTLNVDNMGYAPVVSRLASDHTVNNTTTLASTALSVAVAANATYLVDAVIAYRAGATGASPGLKIAWSVPAGVSGLWAPNGPATATTSAQGNIKFESEAWTDTDTNLGGFDTADLVLRPTGCLVVGGTAGNLVFQFAQNTAAANNLIVRANSLLVATRVA